MAALAERVFTENDQRAFSGLSGDANPMHMDPVAARRTLFGAPVVHGVHLLLWSLESWFLTRSGPAGLTGLTAAFRRGVVVGTDVQTDVIKDGNEFKLRISKRGAVMASIQGRLGPFVNYPEKLVPVQAEACRELDFTSASTAHGILPLAWEPALAEQLFPTLSRWLPTYQLAALLATTRMVGMHCPGLYSTYSELALQFDPATSDSPEMAYQIEEADPRFGLLRIAVRGPGMHGTVGAFMRPRPCLQAPFAELARLVKRDEFAGWRAVVVGGSRGLGEVTAKLLAAGGAKVLVTYHRGRSDAENVQAEISAAGGNCMIVEFDANRAGSFNASELPPTHLFYFAAPRITMDKAEVFSDERFASFCESFVAGFARTLIRFARSAEPIHAFYPSSIFLDEPVPNMAEYCAAKAAGEELCRQLRTRFPDWRIDAPRLPRMLTDQTIGIVPVETEPAAAVMLRELRRMKADHEIASLHTLVR